MYVINRVCLSVNLFVCVCNQCLNFEFMKWKTYIVCTSVCIWLNKRKMLSYGINKIIFRAHRLCFWVMRNFEKVNFYVLIYCDVIIRPTSKLITLIQ